MVVRSWVAVAVATLPGCALISGLGTLSVSDGGSSDDAGTNIDVLTPDVVGLGDANRAGTALQFRGSCAAAAAATPATYSGSGTDFTVAFWLRVDSTSTPSVKSPVVVWHGGRDTTEPGWSVVLTASTLSFCVSDASVAKCTPTYSVQQGHLVHIVAATNHDPPTPLSRVLTLYARDVTAGETTHTSAGSATGAANTWTSTSTFTVGGAFSGNACTNVTSITIDDLRIAGAVVPISAMDSLESANIPCNTLLADFRFDEGAGKTTTDCTSGMSLAIGDGAAWLVSPFP